MDNGRIAYLRNTEGHRVSHGECDGDSRTEVYVKSCKILKSILGYYTPKNYLTSLKTQIKRLNDKSYDDFRYLMEQRIERTTGVVKLDTIQSFIDKGDMLMAVKKILN